MSESYILDVRDLNIDLTLDKESRFLKIQKSNNMTNYNGKIKVNDTIMDINFTNTKKITSKSILKVFGEKNVEI